MYFLLKKITSALLLPLPISILLLILGIILISCSRFYRLGLFSIILSLLILIIFSTQYIPSQLLQNLEGQYPPLIKAPTTINSIVVLGGGLGGNKNYPANTRLDAASLSRLVEAVRLYKQLQNKGITVHVILSGGRVFEAHTIAGDLKNTALILGIHAKDISLEDGSVDTYQEALYLKPLLGTQPFILITSATHMPRAMSIFEKAGMHPIAAPTEFLTERARSPRYYLPSTAHLIDSDIALHEYFGLLWAKFRGFI